MATEKMKSLLKGSIRDVAISVQSDMSVSVNNFMGFHVPMMEKKLLFLLNNSQSS